MGVPKKRTSKMRRDQRRAANNTLKTAVQLTKCANCGASVMPHRVCPACGFYGGKKRISGTAD
ncbi:MAG: 50S ribosomal protein L32 [Archangium sp.]|nr:50S ribosomal protein L32 [Archangium sp.]